MFSFPKKMKLLGSGDDASIMERKLSETCFSEQLGMTDGGKLSLSFFTAPSFNTTV